MSSQQAADQGAERNLLAKVWQPLLSIFSSLNLSCLLLILLGLLTFFGTLAQVELGLHAAQKKYFESYFLVHHIGAVPIPLPGGNLVMWLLFINLMVGGILRMRRHKGTWGVLVIHVGMVMLLVAGFVKLHHAEDGHVTLYEGESSGYFQSYFRWELAAMRQLQDGSVEEHCIPHEEILAAAASSSSEGRWSSEALPFDIELDQFLPHCQPSPKGPMFEVDVPVVDGYYLQELELRAQAEGNLAGAYVTVVPKGDSQARTQGLLWGVERNPWGFDVNGERWGLTLRKERYPMPFNIELERFTKIDHPRSNMPKEFKSDVAVEENGQARQLQISMNEPLRTGGLVVFQASWGPSNARPGDPLFSTFAVVRNPADQWPLMACIVIAIGLLMHFGRKLMIFNKKSRARQAQVEQTTADASASPPEAAQQNTKKAKTKQSREVA